MRKIFLLLFLLFCISGVFALGIQNPDLPKLDKKNIETTSGGTTNNYYINGSSNETNLAHTNQSNNYTEAGDWYWYMDNGAIIFYTSDGFYSVGYGGDSGAGYLGLGDWGVVYNNGRFYIVGDYNYYFNFTALTDNREYIWQDKDGTIALTSDIVNYTFSETNLAHTNQSNDMHYNFIENISYLTWGGASGDEWDFGKTDSNEIRTKDGSISFNGDTYKCYFSTAYGQVWCGANPYAFEVGGNVKFDKNVTIGEKLCNATACFTLTELNTSSSSSSVNPFNQVLNTSSNVSFDSVNATTYSVGTNKKITSQIVGGKSLISIPNATMFGGTPLDNGAFVNINNSDGSVYTLRLEGGTNPTMVLKSSTGTGKLQVLTSDGAVLYGSESNTRIDFIANNQQKASMVPGGAWYFGAYGTPYAGYDFAPATGGSSGGTHLMRVLLSTWAPAFVLKNDGTNGIGITNPSYPWHVSTNVSGISVYGQAGLSGNSLITRSNTICNATACFSLDKLNLTGTTWADLAGVYDTYSYDKAIAYSYWDGSHLQMNQDTKLTWTGDTLSINGNILLPSSGLPTFSGATTDSYNDGIDSQIDFSSGLATAISTAYDESLMKDITYLNRVVNPENVLVPIKFKWSAQGIKQFGDNRTKENYQIGYKAQDVEKFYPDCIVNTYLKQMEGKEQVKTTTPVKTYNKDCLYAYIYAGGLK